ncbi:Adaptor Protein Complex 3 subunit, delta (AP3D) [Carpediemonas membranifera]|uniref:Adaptor Protein Complex 3 subunit, delta (AP3D) n=1 Tax=Carpediemonas membranifera TaxID=201153 RepID=A0A8J6AQH2_9EUKA|nr:Adaptor Protein Complex 3 subunit, delta (AP3D) [Carpediemonas membranifera]|eukprot:KAG9391018.1 Adaptor Protein Complex 3 subunit, delta (AP3D) [Carpediemonas membranifera]
MPRTLQDLVRGVRAHKENEEAYIQDAIKECMAELKTAKMDIKAETVKKVIFIQVLGYDVSFAAFSIIELLGQVKYSHKRIGYLAAPLCLRAASEEFLLLLPNQLRKDIKSGKLEDVGPAVTTAAELSNPLMAQNLIPEITPLLASSKPYIRKKAVMLLYRLLLKNPESLVEVLEPMKALLEDNNPAVVNAAVSVFTELAVRSPKNYIRLSRQMYNIFTSTRNNWTLIKLVKLFSALIPHEPRLCTKLKDKLSEIITTSPAKSLIYEAVVCVADHYPTDKAMLRECLERLDVFIHDKDPNLKYLGLDALSHIVRASRSLVHEYKELAQECLENPDPLLRTKALDLIRETVTKKTLPSVVEVLMKLADPANGDANSFFRNHVVSTVIELMHENDYANVADFDWMVETLIALAKTHASTSGAVIGRHLLEVVARIPDLRETAVELIVPVLSQETAIGLASKNSECAALMDAAVFIVGEYAVLDDPVFLVHTLLSQPVLSGLTRAPGTQAAFVLAAFNIYLRSLCRKDELRAHAIDELDGIIDDCLPLFARVLNPETRDRALIYTGLIAVARKMAGEGNSAAIESLFAGELGPISAKAQRRVKVPEGLVLDAPLLPLDALYGEDQEDLPSDSESEEEQEHVPVQAANPSAFYLGATDSAEVLPAIEQLDIAPIESPAPAGAAPEPAKKKRRHRHRAVTVKRVEEFPSDSDDAPEPSRQAGDRDLLAAIDLDAHDEPAPAPAMEDLLGLGPAQPSPAPTPATDTASAAVDEMFGSLGTTEPKADGHKKKKHHKKHRSSAKEDATLLSAPVTAPAPAKKDPLDDLFSF